MRSSTTTQDSPSALAEGAQRTAEVTRDGDETSNVRENTISFADVARTPEDRDESASEVQASDQDEFGGERGGNDGRRAGGEHGDRGHQARREAGRGRGREPASQPGGASRGGRAGTAVRWPMVYSKQVQATHCREEPSWTARRFTPRGDRWFRVWACPDHTDGLTGLRQFGGVVTE